MHIYFDSGAIQSSSIRLTSPDLMAVRSMSDRDDVFLYTSEIVIDELVSHFEQSLKSSVKNAERHLRILNGFVDTGMRVDQDDILWETIISEYRNELRDIFINSGGKIMSMPNPPHANLVHRSLSKQRPFASGSDGYKDMMIWLSAVELAHRIESDLLFVSGNTTDFAKETDNGHILHPDLQNDISPKSAPILLVTSIEELLNNHLLPNIGELIEIENSVKSMSWDILDLPKELETIIETQLDYRSQKWESDPFWVDQGLIYVEEVVEAIVARIESVRASRLDGGVHISLIASGDLGVIVEAEGDTWLGDQLDDDFERRHIKRGRITFPMSVRVGLFFDTHWELVSESVELIRNSKQVLFY